MAFPPFLVKQLHRCDAVVISSFVRTGYTMRRWGWLLGRIRYSIRHHYPLYLKITGILNNVFRPQKALKKTRIKLYNTLALPVLLYGSETWTVKASDARRITAAEMECMRRTAGYTWTDYKTNEQIAKELKITPILEKLLAYKRSWIQHVNRMTRNRLPRVMKHYCPTGRRNHGRPLKRLVDTWDRNGSTSGPTPWKLYDDDGSDKQLLSDKIMSH